MHCKRSILYFLIFLCIFIFSCKAKTPTQPNFSYFDRGKTDAEGHEAVVFYEGEQLMVVHINAKNENNQPLSNIEVEGYLQGSKYLILVYDLSDNYFPNIKISSIRQNEVVWLDIILKAINMTVAARDLREAIIELEANPDEIIEFIDSTSPWCYDEEMFTRSYDMTYKFYDPLLVIAPFFNHIPRVFAVVPKVISTAELDKDFIHAFFKEGNVYKNLKIIVDVNFVFMHDLGLCESEIDYFAASPLNIKKGESSTLRWSTENATEVYIEPEIGRVEKEGTITVSPGETTTYTLRAKNLTKEQSTSVTIDVS